MPEAVGQRAAAQSAAARPVPVASAAVSPTGPVATAGRAGHEVAAAATAGAATRTGAPAVDEQALGALAPRSSRRPAARLGSVPWWMRLLLWIVAVPLAFLFVFLVARAFGVFTTNQLSDLFLANNTARFWPVARLLPFVALVTALLVTLGVYLLARCAARRPRRSALAERAQRVGESNARADEPAGRRHGCGRVRELGEEVLHRVGRERAGEHEALAAVALFLLQLTELVLLLDALGERLQPELLAELHERADERARLGRVADRAHERAVDLEDVDGELPQVRERRVAGSEVVDGDADAELLDRAELLCGRVGVVHDRGLGELDDEPGRRKAGRLERVRAGRGRGGRRRVGGRRR